ncbi:MAG: hypothetical protein NZM40_06470 [Sphingomonadaceae bacterium]|uniref:hypothetical protein n=1 Tax=Thermaurantiacus sp. TaxID=2820283 RepID=UPI00298F27B8|nr:hypothetical protein [Thermaurantiacus sp.]MCS6987062.1 hypothetical protein [Sphingomonadaceae bacterium]MDW8415600.1 hypothetical protein [Thermaurantiacus sp.]
MRGRALGLALWAALATPPTMPASAGPAADAFAGGDWARAAELGARGTTADERIAQARALSVLATYEARERDRAEALLEEAIAAAAAAVELEPRNARALAERAIVTGYLSKLKRSPREARAARRDAEAALHLDPGLALAHAVLGGWHLEAVATLGAFLARTTLGARMAEGERHFARAHALKPDSALFPVFHAFALLALGPERGPDAQALLERAAAARPADAYERRVQAQGRQVLGLLARGEVARARALARALSPLGRIER